MTIKKGLAFQKVAWQEGLPISLNYRDIFFPKSNPLQASYLTFIKNSQFVKKAQAFPYVTIIEVGFGFGLNFFLTVDTLLKEVNSNTRLYYYGIEESPISNIDIERCAKTHYPQLIPLLNDFIESNFLPIQGLQRRYLYKEQVALTLCYGNVKDMLADINATADIWFLDGHNPKTNRECWSNEVFLEISKRSVKGTVAVSWAVSREVKDRLTKNNFTIEKVKGYPPKRENIIAYYNGEKSREVPLARKNIGIIGGSIAGASVGYFLSLMGANVTIIDKREKNILQSNKKRGVLFPYFSLEDNSLSLTYLYSYLYAHDFFSRVLKDSGFEQSGIIHIPLTKRLLKLSLSGSVATLPKEIFAVITKEEAEDIAKIKFKNYNDRLFFYYKMGGWFYPLQVLKAIYKAIKGEFYFGKHIVSITPNIKGKVRIKTQEGDILFFDKLVLSLGSDIKHFFDFLPVNQVRGQIEVVQATPLSKQMQTVLCYDGYALPAVNNEHILGASYIRNFKDLMPSDRERDEILNKPKKYSINFNGLKDSKESLVGVRCTVFDKLPLVGEFPFLNRLKEANIADNNIYLLTGFGSRGYTSAPFCAELLSSFIVGYPQGVAQSIKCFIMADRIKKPLPLKVGEGGEET